MAQYMIERLMIDRSEVEFEYGRTALLHAGADPARPVPEDSSWQVEVNGHPLHVMTGETVLLEMQIEGGRLFAGEALVRQEFADHVPEVPTARYSFLAQGPLVEREYIAEGPAREIEPLEGW
jgi:hypothetical protein